MLPSPCDSDIDASWRTKRCYISFARVLINLLQFSYIISKLKPASDIQQQLIGTFLSLFLKFKSRREDKVSLSFHLNF